MTMRMQSKSWPTHRRPKRFLLGKLMERVKTKCSLTNRVDFAIHKIFEPRIIENMAQRVIDLCFNLFLTNLGHLGEISSTPPLGFHCFSTWSLSSLCSRSVLETRLAFRWYPLQNVPNSMEKSLGGRHTSQYLYLLNVLSSNLLWKTQGWSL